MPFQFTVSDFSDYFTITSPPQTVANTISQSISTSESLTRSVRTYFNSRNVSQTLTLSQSLSHSIDTYRQARTINQSFSTSETLNRSVRQFFNDFTINQSFSLSQSLSHSFDTWKHTVSMNMPLNTSTSTPSHTITTYRQDRTISQGLSTSQSLTSQVDTFKFISTPNHSLNTSETLSKTVEDWFHTRNTSDTANITDSFNAQISIDNDTYFYDNYNSTGMTKLVGSITGGNFTSDSSKVENVSSLNDSSVDTSTTFKSTFSKACIVYDLSTAQPVDFIAIYVKEILSDPIQVFSSNSQGTGYSLVTQISGSSNNWNITPFTSQNIRYLAFQMNQTGADTLINELYFGKSFKPEVRYSVGSSTSMDSNNIINTSYKGNEYSHTTQETETKFVNTYSNISNALKLQFEDLSNKSNNKKLIYNKQGIHYLLPQPITFTEVALNRYSTEIVLVT